jgi:hypothetical protein
MRFSNHLPQMNSEKVFFFVQNAGCDFSLSIFGGHYGQKVVEQIKMALNLKKTKNK